MNKIALAIHGGAGTLRRGEMTAEKENEYREALQHALHEGYAIIEAGGSATDAVEKAVVELENSPLFNAGRGSVFSSNGKHEMDASIMEGKNKDAGAVSLVSGVKNPISLARAVMDKSEHVFLAGEGAMHFAKDHQFTTEPDSYFFDEFRHQQWLDIRDSDHFQLDHSNNKDHKFGTVGAVAVDVQGNLAAATSTGGMTNKKYGRVGDSPIIGAGTYANNQTCAVSCTGSGEYFIRAVVAYEVSALMEFKGLSLQEAADEAVLTRLPKIQGDGGLIAVDKFGNIALPFNTEGMYRGWKNASNEEIAIYEKT